MVGTLGGSLTSGASANERQLLMLASIAADPVTFAKRLQEYSAARIACEEQAQESARKLKEATEAEKKLNAAIAEFEQRMNEGGRILDSRREDLEKRAESLVRGKEALHSAQVEQKARKEDLDALAADLDEREGSARRQKKAHAEAVAAFEAERAEFEARRERIRRAEE